MDIENFDFIIGKTIKSFNLNDNKTELIFISEDDKIYKMFYHNMGNSECVLEDIVGDLNDLVGMPILKAYKTIENGKSKINKFFNDWELWTFYNFSTIKGTITLKWVDIDDYYYSVEVQFEEIKNKRS